MASGQKERFLFGRKVLVFLKDSQVRVIPFEISEGVRHGSGRAPFLLFSFAAERSRRSHGAWPCGVTSAMTSKVSR